MKTSTMGFGLFMLALCAAVAFIGCDNAMTGAADTAALDTGRAAAIFDAAASDDTTAVTVSGTVAVIDGAYAVLYQGNAYHVKGLTRLAGSPELAEGAEVTITGKAAPILDRDAEGNSLFYGYYLKAETIAVNG